MVHTYIWLLNCSCGEKKGNRRYSRNDLVRIDFILEREPLVSSSIFRFKDDVSVHRANKSSREICIRSYDRVSEVLNGGWRAVCGGAFADQKRILQREKRPQPLLILELCFVYRRSPKWKCFQRLPRFIYISLSLSLKKQTISSTAAAEVTHKLFFWLLLFYYSGYDR